jgi:hypothetical protein
MDHFKFELIRASAAQEITHSRSTKFAAVTATELVDAFIDFALGCGYDRESLVETFAEYIDDEPQQYCLEAMDPPDEAAAILDYYSALAAQHSAGQAVFHAPPGKENVDG